MTGSCSYSLTLWGQPYSQMKVASWIELLASLHTNLATKNGLHFVQTYCLSSIITVWPSYAGVPAEYTCDVSPLLTQPSIRRHKGLSAFTSSIMAYLPMKRRNEQQNVKPQFLAKLRVWAQSSPLNLTQLLTKWNKAICLWMLFLIT